jgi:hypothetical protein
MSIALTRRRLLTSGGLAALLPALAARPAAALPPDPPAPLVTLRTPVRAFDSRSTGGRNQKLVHDDFVVVHLPVGVDITSAFVNVTITDTTGTGFLTIAESPIFGGDVPEYSTVNWSTAGQTLANLTLVTVDFENLIAVNCFGNGSTHFLIDVLGYQTA